MKEKKNQDILIKLGSTKLHKDSKMALPGVAQWIEHRPVNQNVAGSIPSQSTAQLVPGQRARSPVGGMQEATNLCFTHTLMFLSLSPFLPLSLTISEFKKRVK